ncbi:cyclic pyranopterin monophosphate synthase MoaC [Pedomonas mirosovicensis]|uniref:cyclic pyranopterin monophosphate synthase MoaC n=1 Tax=Pedomonas mirosovicensis TaxID=2908641 RepID=UPI002168C319|nr:cyclic pyranopterin monophosphate synthase MoaC [Pedomonas mirosovicensis]MCH8685391.1 cyclic pyranopterin monophosphate synthase MoaC [Pedomonas mirosovicensis]
MAGGLSHIGAGGEAHMVDVSAKAATERRALATGRILMSPQAFAAVRDNAIAKGDVLSVARVAGIMAAKRTSDLIPLCHPLPIQKISVDFALEEQDFAISVMAMVKTTGQTGVEMEALTAASIALLTVYDMAKAVDKAMRIEGVRLLEKTGGKSGTFKAEA